MYLRVPGSNMLSFDRAAMTAALKAMPDHPANATVKGAKNG